VLSDALPLIAESQFARARALIDSSKASQFRDEVDILEGTAVALIVRLQSLGGQVEERDQALTLRIDQLRNQTEFVDRLLEHAQLAILVHDGRHDMVRSNSGGRAVLEFLRPGAKLSSLFASDAGAAEVDQSLQQRLAEPAGAPIESASQVGDGTKRRHLQWLHCPVQGPDAQPLILSVGLDVTREREAMAELSWMADHDALTGLFNRRRVDREISELTAAHEPFALLFIDLDDFGLVNKSDGHEAGNEVLITVGRLLERNLASRDLVSRTGGDEFMIILRESRSELVESTAKRLIALLSAPITAASGNTHELSCCIGIGIFPNLCSSKAELFSHADAALLEAKQAGRGEYVIRADAHSLVERSQHLSRWKERMLDALANERLFLLFQPITQLSSGKLSHFECLVRMRRSDGSVASPGEFIPVAEETGLIHRIDYWVIEASMTVLKDLNEFRPELGLAVNISGPTLQRPDFLSTVKQLIAQSGLSRPRLILELTETAALRDIQAVQGTMTELCALGCEFALDDFGVGHSSFAYLRDLPFAYVKLDGSYVRQVIKDQRNQAFVSAMVVLANGYQLKTIAEFVESQELQDFLRDAGVHYGQGYHIAKPGPLPDYRPTAARPIGLA
jgi:diguanylate cyclase (GGDEF)-like protein